MSDVNNNGSNPAQALAANGSEPTESEFVMPELTGQQAKELAEESKATGKSIEDLIKAKSGAPAKDVSQPTAEQKEAAREAIRKFKVKVDGSEREVDEGELLRGYSHQQAANKILQEGRAAKKQAEEFLTMMKDPERFYEVAKQLGHDPRSLSEKYLVSQIEEELLDPREKELRDARKKLKSIEDMERQQKEMVEKQRLEEMKTKYVKDYEEKFVGALQESGLPATKAMVGEMAKYISRSAKIGFKMEPSEAAQLVKEDIQKAQMSLIGNADGETLLRLLGDDVAAKILQARGSKVKSTGFNTPSIQGERREIQQKGDGKRMTQKEWAEFKRRK